MARKRALVFNPGDFVKKICTQETTREYRNKELIYSQGDKADAVFYIQDGTVKLTAESTGGKKAVLAILHQRDFFGEGCLKRRSLRISSAISIGSSTITRLRKDPFVRLIRCEPRFARRFIEYLTSRIDQTKGELKEQFFDNSEKRLARVLLRLGQGGEKSNFQPATMKVNQSSLAEMVGTTRARVSYFMTRFRRKGFVRYNGSLQIKRAPLIAMLRS